MDDTQSINLVNISLIGWVVNFADESQEWIFRDDSVGPFVCRKVSESCQVTFWKTEGGSAITNTEKCKPLSFLHLSMTSWNPICAQAFVYPYHQDQNLWAVRYVEWVKLKGYLNWLFAFIASVVKQISQTREKGELNFKKEFKSDSSH